MESYLPNVNEYLVCIFLLWLGSFSFVIMLKDESELEYPQSEIRARQHWYPVSQYFSEHESLCCKGHISVSVVWKFVLCVLPANRRKWSPSYPVTSVLYLGRVRPMRLLLQWQLWVAWCPHSKACHRSSLAWGIPCMVRNSLLGLYNIVK